MTYGMIERELADGSTHIVYQYIDDLVSNNYSSDLGEAVILAVWKYGCKPDVDGHIFKSHIRKTTPVEKLRDVGDLILIINGDLWNSPDANERYRLEVIDQCLCRVKVVLDKNDDPKVDKNGKIHI